MVRPGIVVLSADTDDQFEWMSDSWYQIKRRHTREAQRLMAKAKAAIEAADNVPDAIRRLEAAGFDVRRAEPGEAEWMEGELTR